MKYLLVNMMKVFSKIKELALVGIGGLSGIAGLAGTFGLCCSPLVGGLFALFGISSTAFLLSYNWLFLAFSLFAFVLLMWHIKSQKACQLKN
ncbi:MAG: hypothetical protein N3G80_01905 [Candidatus Micrarchaeota archaeon]|nr:hypothetical protein [Candidatus Micrarchaeota archaeon]